MRFRSAFGFVVAASLLAVACGSDDVGGPVAPVHGSEPIGPVALPRMKSNPLPNIPHAWPLARTKAGMLRGIGVTSGPDGTSGTNTAALITTNRNLVQKTLVLTGDATQPSFQAAVDSLDRIGVPYDARVVVQNGAPTGLDPATLTDGVSTCFYNSVILATDALVYYDGTNYQSAFSAQDWQTLADFESACSAREAIWYAWPNPGLGLTYAGTSFIDTDSVDASVAQPSFFAALRATALLPIRNAAGYYADIADTSTTSLLQANGHTLMVLHTYADGRQTVVSTFDRNQYQVHSWALEYDVIRWLTNGMFLGKKRAYLTPQVDDVFIDDDMWDVATHLDDGVSQLRITGSDIVGLNTWESGLRQHLPSGSSFFPVFAFNGYGTLKSSYSDGSLLNQALRYNKSFLWLSHTWDHENMDAMTQSAAYSEANQNIRVASNDRLNGFSKTEMVTPDVSGLGNYAALEGIFQAGVRVVVSNTSVAGGGNPEFNVGMANAIEPRIYEVPRHPTNIYYNTATPDEQLDEYNTIYRDHYGRDLSYAEMIDADSTIGVSYLFTGDVDPLMFHQPNLANYNAGTTNPPASLYGDWINAVTSKFTALSNAPIKTLQQRDIATAMQQRAAYDACGVSATIVESSTGRTLQLHATNACVVPVTGLSASTAGSVESYLGTTTTSVTLSAGQVKSIALP